MRLINGKALKKLFLITAVALCCCCTFFGCNSTEEPESSSSSSSSAPAPEVHTHTLTKTEEQLPTCTQTGNEAYYTCSGCEKLFADAEANEELMEIPVLQKTEHSYTATLVSETYLASSATCTAKATYFKSCTCGLASTSETFEYGDYAQHAHTQEVAEQKYLASSATCTAKATYFKSCICGDKGTETFEYGDFATHAKYDLIVNDEALVEQTADTYYLSCVDCGALSQDTTTVAEFLGLENGMAFTQLQGFNIALPEDTTLQVESYKVKLTDGTLKAEYTGGDMTNFTTAFNALSPKFVYLLEYKVSNGTDTDEFEGVIDFSVNTVDTVSIAQTESGLENLNPVGSKAQLIYVENIGGRKGAYEWTTGSTQETQANATLSLSNNAVNRKNAVEGNYLYFDIYTTHDFPLTIIDATTTQGKKYYLYSTSYTAVTKYNALGTKITSNEQSTWKGKWITVEMKLQCDWLFDNQYRGITIPANNAYGLIDTDSKHIYLDNFRISTYSIYGMIEGATECTDAHDFTAKVPQPKYLAHSATCQEQASFYLSCSVCGAKGTETFKAGEIGTHDLSKNTETEYLAKTATCQEPAKYYYSCSVCGYKHGKTFSHGSVGTHEYNKEVADEKYLVSEKTPTQNAVYYKSCVCGLASTSETFEYDETLPESIVVSVNPNKMQYANGEKFDATGMVVTAYLRNGEEETATDYTLSHSVLSYPFDSLKIYYKGVETELLITVYEFTVADVIVEVANAYDRQNGQVHYEQYNSRRTFTVSPEEATAQKYIYLDCSSFVNTVYREAFGVNIIPFIPTSLGSMPDGSWVPSTSNYRNYAKNYGTNVDVIGYWENANYTTTAEQTALLAEVRGMLQVGDVLNYRHVNSKEVGHVYIYLGDDIFIHHSGSGDYKYNSNDPALSYDVEGNKSYGSIITNTADDLFVDTTHTRYLFKNTTSDKVVSFALLRPLARGLSVTQKSIDRMKIAGLSMEKTSSVGINSAVRTGDMITYTITLDNKVTTKHTGVTIRDILPAGTEYVSGSGTAGVSVDGQNLTWTGDVASKTQVTVSYSVKVTQTTSGALIVSDSTYVSGIKLSKIVQTVSGFTVEQTNALVAKAGEYISTAKSFTNPILMAQTLYIEALGKTVFNYATPVDALGDILDKQKLTKKTDTDISKMVAPNLYGGLDIATGQRNLEDSERCRLVTEEQLAVGDIILAEWSGGSRVFVYLGNSKLICCATDNLTCQELTIGDNIYEGADNILVTFIAYDGYAVLRPSMVA